VPDIVLAVDIEDGCGDQVSEDVIARAARAAIEVGLTGSPLREQLGRTDCFEISVSLTDDAAMRHLNREYRGVDRTTDVLSFSLQEEGGPPVSYPPGIPVPLGEIVLSGPYLKHQADALGHPLATEVAWLTVHGALQLLGYRHDTDAEAELMERLERAALESSGFSPD